VHEVKEDIKHDTKSAAKATGHAARDFGHATASAAKTVGHGIAHGTREGWDATKHATHEGWDATKRTTKRVFHKDDAPARTTLKSSHPARHDGVFIRHAAVHPGRAPGITRPRAIASPDARQTGLARRSLLRTANLPAFCPVAPATRQNTGFEPARAHVFPPAAPHTGPEHGEAARETQRRPARPDARPRARPLE
jgi:hypothetical protein